MQGIAPWVGWLGVVLVVGGLAGAHGDQAGDHATSCVGTAPVPAACGLLTHAPSFGGTGSVTWFGPYTGKVVLDVNSGAFVRSCDVLLGTSLGCNTLGAVPAGVPLAPTCRSYILFAPAPVAGGAGDFGCTFIHF